MTWNIKTGGVDRGRGDRLSAIIEVIDRERPDILALQELRDFTRHNSRRMRALADAVGMTSHLAPAAFGQAVAVLVRPPLRLTRCKTVRWRLHHAVAVATVPVDAGPLRVVSTHLNPFSGYRRRREASWLAARYASGKRLVLLAGDLNSLDPGTDHTDELARLPELYRRRHLDAEGRVDTRAIAAFAAAGLTDLWTVAGQDAGHTAPTTEGGGPEFSGMRLDYVLGSAPVAARTRSLRVVRAGAAEHASDHYPLTADLDLR